MSVIDVFFLRIACSLILFQMFTSVRVFRLNNVNLTNQGLNKIFNDLCENLLKVGPVLGT